MPAANEHPPSFASASMPAEAQPWAEIALSSAPKEDDVLATADDDSQGTVSDCVFSVSVDEEEVVQDPEVSSSTLALMYGDILGGVAADESALAAEALGLCG